MAPARIDASDDDDPVTAEYDVFLTPQHAEQVLLLQYPNRVRGRPYNDRFGACPSDIRIKPATGFLEVDVGLNTTFNFNKYKGLQWGDALATSRDVHNSSGTYGPAAGFSGAKRGAPGRGGAAMKDAVARETQISNDLLSFPSAEAENKVMRTQTLGGQILRHDSDEEAGKPFYFVGAFRNNELHLTQLSGTAQMRPQFHHLDAEEQRARLASQRDTAAAGEARPQAEARSLLSREKKPDDTRDRFEDRTRRMWMEAEAEEWTNVEYVDEDMQDAYDKFAERLFVKDAEKAPKLESKMDTWDYLDKISAPRRDSPTRRRKRPPRRRQVDEEEEAEAESGAAAGAIGEEQGHPIDAEPMETEMGGE